MQEEGDGEVADVEVAGKFFAASAMPSLAVLLPKASTTLAKSARLSNPLLAPRSPHL